MESEKGITLISLIIYVIVMLIVVTIIGTVTSYFYANVNKEYTENAYTESELEMYLVKDLKNKKITIGNTDDFESGTSNMITIIFEDGTSVVYTITDDGIYRNQVKIFTKETSDVINFSLEDIPTDVANKKQIINLNKNGEVFKSYIVYIK